MRRFKSALFTLLAIVSPVPAASQGVVAGSVEDGQTGSPLASVQVYIERLDIGVLSQGNGRYLILNVPAGTHEVTAQRIGYGAVTHTVTVGAGGTSVQDFSLTAQALGLDEIVVTGTAGGTQRRAIGNVVEQMDLSGMMNTRAGAVTSLEQAISDRIPGVAFIGAPGGAGQGSQIRLRRSASLAIPADPIIFVDGVRMNSGRQGVDRYSSVSTLNDIDPRDIESIEIIKGPAAATLYGTEAANGVIQIITKRGVEGAPTFDVSVETGGMWLPHNDITNVWAPDPAKCSGPPCASHDDLVKINMYDAELARGNKIFRVGQTQSYNVSVRGGTPTLRYFASVNRDDQDGIVSWNYDKRNSLRTSLSVTPSESLTLTLNGSYNQGENSRPGAFWASNFAWGGVPAGELSGAPGRGFGNAPPEEYEEDSSFDRIHSNRATVSFEATFEPVSWLTHKAVVGYDRYTNKGVTMMIKDAPAAQFMGSCGLIGCRTVSALESPVTTVDFSGSARFDLTEAVSSQTSYGIQYYHTDETAITSSGEGFATSALRTLGSAASTTAIETFVENTTLGLYVQQQIGLNDRLFLTGAVRVDDNSAFGQDFGGAVYPKFSATWVVSEESFWNLDLLNQLRLRSAWGAAGQQPDAFAATRLYTPETGPNSQPILVPSSFGNPELGPERGEELEVGFDASLLDDRVSLSFTRFWRKTTNALITKTVGPSAGVPGPTGSLTGPTQLVNIGEIKAWGTETQLSVRALTQDPVRWDLNLSVTTGGNRIEDMGGLGRIQVQRGRAHEQGFGLASIIDKKVLSADFVNGVNGAVTNVMCDGGTGFRGMMQGGAAVPCSEAPQVYYGVTEPRWLVSLGSTWTLFSDWTLSATVAGQGGHWMASDYLGARHQSFVSSEMYYLQDNAIGQAYLDIARSGLTYHKAGFVKLREVSLGYNVPDALTARIGADRARINIGVTNPATLYLRQECPAAEPRVCATDPEMNRPTEDFWGEPAGSWPPLKQVTASVSVTF